MGGRLAIYCPASFCGDAARLVLPFPPPTVIPAKAGIHTPASAAAGLPVLPFPPSSKLPFPHYIVVPPCTVIPAKAGIHTPAFAAAGWPTFPALYGQKGFPAYT